MPKSKVLITRQIAAKGLQMIQEECNADVWEGELPPPVEELARRARGVDGLLCLLTDPINEAFLAAAGPGLKVISNMAVGYDNIDVPAATRLQIPVGNTPGILTETTADFCFALLLACARRIVESEGAIRKGLWKTWSPQWLLGVDVHHATLGVVGFGRIGQAVARRAAGFDMQVIFSDPNPPPNWEACGVKAKPVSFDTLLAESDFVSIHTPLSEQTRGLFGMETFAKMKKGAILINTARGPIVDQNALYNALKNGQILAAGLDVTVPEPLPCDHELLELDNLIITPHVASASRATREKMAVMAAENLLAGVRGERLPYCVNPEVYQNFNQRL